MPAIITPAGFLSFPALYVPKPRSPGAEPVYSCALIIPPEQVKKDSYKALVKACEDAARERFPKLKLSQLTMPFRSCDEKEYAGYEKGQYFITPWSKQRPSVVDTDRDEITDSNDVWPGQWARLYVTPFAWENTGKKGVSLGLNHVQILKSEGMDRLDGRKSAQDAFADADEDEEV